MAARQAGRRTGSRQECRRAEGGHAGLKVHKIDNFFVSDFGICVISLLVMYKK